MCERSGSDPYWCDKHQADFPSDELDCAGSRARRVILDWDEDSRPWTVPAVDFDRALPGFTR